MSETIVIDYGMGNLRSAWRALQKAGDGRSSVLISADPERVRRAERVVFPGQGAMPDCMAELARSGLDEAVRETAKQKPFLGICVGMQMLFESSQEVHQNKGDSLTPPSSSTNAKSHLMPTDIPPCSDHVTTQGLGILAGHVLHFRTLISASSAPLSNPDRSPPLPNQRPLKIPQMGWNEVYQREHPLWQGIADNSRYYFVHSFYASPAVDNIVAGTSDYGGCFTAAVAKDNIFAVQFHPEKSQVVGLQLLRNFMSWKP